MDQSQSAILETAHVLLMDVVGYSLLPIDRQAKLIDELQEVVGATAEFQRANARQDLIRLPTGDGMGLVFFKGSTSPVQCALEVATTLLKMPEMKLRMGIHTGPVYRV